MAFLFTSIILLVCDGLLIFYLANSKFFTPMKFTGEVDVINIFLFIVLVSSFLGIFISLVIFLAEKFLYCGKKEFPRSTRAIKYGFLTGFVLAILILLHIFHFLNFFVGLVLFALLVIGIMIIR